MWDDKYMKVKGNLFISYMFTLYLEKCDAEAYVEVYLHNWKTFSEKTLNIFHKSQEIQFDFPFISCNSYRVCYRITVQLSTWESLAHLILWTAQVSPVQLSLFLSIFSCSHLSGLLSCWCRKVSNVPEGYDCYRSSVGCSFAKLR